MSEQKVNLYAPENVVPFLRERASESIAGKQYAHAADEIERLREALLCLLPGLVLDLRYADDDDDKDALRSRIETVESALANAHPR